MDARKRKNAKMLAAYIGASALVALIAVGVLAAVDSPEEAETGAYPKMTLGETTTQTTPPHAPVSSKALPPIKGPAPLPSEEEAAK
ncbi:hypothetical protein [Mycobacterium hubeiense]|uniref:hypothetical protein n=1 Tax=Mycobacterium hubeiense TaxID=1867256 RepID=UPI000C7F25D9|nr:hypothetical protein [Mycobacterium sp. QGD 101]